MPRPYQPEKTGRARHSVRAVVAIARKWRAEDWPAPPLLRRLAHYRREPEAAFDVVAVLEHYCAMSTLAEIEQAAEKLSPQQKQELMLFLGAKLRSERTGLPEPRQLSREQIQSWITEDEADLKRFREQS